MIPSYIRTYTGRAFPIRPKACDVDLVDIAHGLSIAPRWGGQSRFRYSVAAHAIYVSKLVPDKYKFAALHHDDSEAYFCDIPKPFKAQMPEYTELERGIMEACADRFGFGWPMHEVIHKADQIALYEERMALFSFPLQGDVPICRAPKNTKWDFEDWGRLTDYELESDFIYYHNAYAKLCS